VRLRLDGSGCAGAHVDKTIYQQAHTSVKRKLAQAVGRGAIYLAGLLMRVFADAVTIRPTTEH